MAISKFPTLLLLLLCVSSCRFSEANDEVDSSLALSPAPTMAGGVRDIVAENLKLCVRHLHTFRVVQTDAAGGRCWDNVSAWSCRGRCSSYELGSPKFPHLVAHHPVCVHAGRSKVAVELRNCDEGVAETARVYEYLEADACRCQVCLKENTLCTSLKVSSMFDNSLPIHNDGALRSDAVYWNLK